MPTYIATYLQTPIPGRRKSNPSRALFAKGEIFWTYTAKSKSHALKKAEKEARSMKKLDPSLETTLTGVVEKDHFVLPPIPPC